MKTLPNDYARCAGMWVDDDEHSSWREGCEHCLRRTSPRPDGYKMIAPPPIIAFECEYLIEPDDKIENKPKSMKDKQTMNILGIDLPRIARLWNFLRYNRYTLFTGIVWRPVTGDDGDSWVQSWRKYRMSWKTAWEVACVVYPLSSSEVYNNKPRT